MHAQSLTFLETYTFVDLSVTGFFSARKERAEESNLSAYNYIIHQRTSLFVCSKIVFFVSNTKEIYERKKREKIFSVDFKHK